MPDISKCTGEGCTQKNTCYRFTSKPSEFLQSYFVTPPHFNNNCEMRMDDSGWSEQSKIPLEQRQPTP